MYGYFTSILTREVLGSSGYGIRDINHFPSKAITAASTVLLLRKGSSIVCMEL